MFSDESYVRLKSNKDNILKIAADNGIINVKITRTINEESGNMITFLYEGEINKDVRESLKTRFGEMLNCKINLSSEHNAYESLTKLPHLKDKIIPVIYSAIDLDKIDFNKSLGEQFEAKLSLYKEKQSSWEFKKEKNKFKRKPDEEIIDEEYVKNNADKIADFFKGNPYVKKEFLKRHKYSSQKIESV